MFRRSGRRCEVRAVLRQVTRLLAEFMIERLHPSKARASLIGAPAAKGNNDALLASNPQ